MQDINTLVNSATIMDETSKRVFAEKKAALEKGEDAAVAQMGEQRDIMSTLRKPQSFSLTNPLLTDL